MKTRSGNRLPAALAKPLRQVGWLGLLAASIAVAAPAPPDASAPVPVEHHAGKFVYMTLVTPDPAAAKTFYGGLFGWTFHDAQAGAQRYIDASLDGDTVAGIVYRPIRPNERRQPAWLGFVAVNDVDASSKTAERLGAKTLSAPHDVAGRGRVAVLADPQGAAVGILQATAGDSPDVLPSAGEWIWASLFTRDPDAAAGFYQSVFDYEVFDPDPDVDGHLVLSSDGYARAAVNPLPGERALPHWLNYVRVDDAVASAAKATALGGKVLLAPRADRNGGKLAIVADPQGAPFGLLEWPDDRPTKELP